MPLNFLYGEKPNQSHVFEKIKNSIDNSSKVLYIVPEQYSFLADKTILDTLSEKYSHMTETLNFMRMANLTNNLYSAPKTEFLDDEIKNLILYRVLSQEKNLSTLKKRAISPDNVLIFKEIIAECKHHLIDDKKLDDIKNQLSDNKFLYNKINDLSIVMHEYQKLTTDKYHDFEDSLITLAKNINKHGLFKDYDIFVDNFSTFSSAEYLILKELIKNCKNMYITLISDNFSDCEPDSLFYPTKITYKKLTKICESINTPYYEKNIADSSDEFFKNLLSEPENPPADITLTTAKNNRDEVRAAVSKIKEIIKNGGIFSDISLYTGDLSAYKDFIEDEFLAAEIPYFMDKSVPLIENPICRLLLTALNTVISNYSIDATSEYIKSLVFLYDNHIEACVFEELINRFNISKDQLSNEEKWQKNLDFIKERKIFPNIDETEKMYTSFILPLKSAFKNPSSYYYGYKQLIEALKIEKYLEKYISEDPGRQEYITCYNTFIKAIKNIEVMLTGEKFSKNDYYNILLQSLSVYKTGILPNFIDVITVSDTERSRDVNKKYVFVLGMNEGVTPPNSQNNGFLSDMERELILDASGIELPTTMFKNSNSNLSLYRIFTSYGEKLFLSQSEENGENEKQMPSFYWQRMAEIYEVNYFENECVNLQELTTYAVSRNLSPFSYSESRDNELMEKLSQNKDAGILFENIKDIKKDGYFEQNKRLSKKILDSKYNKKLNTSVSRLETYKRCGYSYFIQYILKISERENTSYDFMKTGTLVHNIIDRFSKKMVSDKIDWETVDNTYIEATLPSLVNREILSAFPETTLFNTRTKYLIKKLTRTATTAILNIKEHFTSGDFVPIGYEIEIGSDETSGIPPITIALSDGSTMQIFGRIDRADKLKISENELYVRIIDYKSSSKDFEFAMIKEGIQLQLLTYLKALIENGGKYLDFSGEILPGAAFYVAIDDSIPSFSEKPANHEIVSKINEKFKLTGLVLNDDTLIEAIDREFSTADSYSSKVCDVSKSKSSGFKLSNLLFLEQFKKLLFECETTLKEIGSQISEGYVPIKPYRYGKKQACEYCSYKSVCLFDNTMHHYNNIKKLKKDEYFTVNSEQ